MTRTQKIERIRIYRPCLYMTLTKLVPQLVAYPEYASPADIEVYNYHVSRESLVDNNKSAFKNRFSF